MSSKFLLGYPRSVLCPLCHKANLLCIMSQRYMTEQTEASVKSDTDSAFPFKVKEIYKL